MFFFVSHGFICSTMWAASNMVLVYNFPPRQQIIPGVEHKNESLGKHLVVGTTTYYYPTII